MDKYEADRNEARSLLLAARKDWQALGGMRDGTVFADEIFGFHAQQAVEKTLKAWLALSGVEYPRTHDISLLLSVLAMQGQNVEDDYDLLEFNPYAVQFRYEAFAEIGEPLKRGKVIERVGALLCRVEDLLNA
jgi:HEPN domain-containing protein